MFLLLFSAGEDEVQAAVAVYIEWHEGKVADEVARLWGQTREGKGSRPGKGVSLVPIEHSFGPEFR